MTLFINPNMNISISVVLVYSIFAVKFHYVNEHT